MSDPVAVDLFAGAGGASCGIDAAGFDLAAAVDTDTNALTTHADNLPGYTVAHDLSDVDVSVLPKRAHDPTYAHGSPPCKGFSTANDDRHLDDPRNSLVFAFIDWVAELQPAVVTMENVTGMLSIADHFMDRVETAFREAGYRVKYRTLNAADYGVPQTRKRVITVGVRDDVAPPSRWFPRPTHAETATTTLDGRTLDEWVTVEEAIGDLAGRVRSSRERPRRQHTIRDRRRTTTPATQPTTTPTSGSPRNRRRRCKPTPASPTRTAHPEISPPTGRAHGGSPSANVLASSRSPTGSCSTGPRPPNTHRSATPSRRSSNTISPTIFGRWSDDRSPRPRLPVVWGGAPRGPRPR